MTKVLIVVTTCCKCTGTFAVPSQSTPETKRLGVYISSGCGIPISDEWNMSAVLTAVFTGR